MIEKQKEKPETLLQRRIFTISDYEISNGVLKFFNKEGLLKKKLVLVREIPVNEIANVESYWNELSITWNGITNIFFKKDSLESFSDLRDKIRALIEECKETKAQEEKAKAQCTDRLKLLYNILPIVDVCFDTLMRLHAKSVEWSPITQDYTNLPLKVSSSNQILPVFDLDLSNFIQAINNKNTFIVANEAFSILKNIRAYFLSSNPFESSINKDLIIDNIVNMLDSYLVINDIFLAKTVCDNETDVETTFLQTLLLALSENATSKVKTEEILLNIGQFNNQNKDNVIVGSRNLFKEWLSINIAK